jgi:hypothetical protein
MEEVKKIMILKRALGLSIILSLLFLVFAGCSSENPVASGGNLAPGTAPDLVLAAANKAVPGGEVTGVDEEEENGQTIYEVQKEVDGVKYEIEVTADGEVLKIEEEERKLQ